MRSRLQPHRADERQHELDPLTPAQRVARDFRESQRRHRRAARHFMCNQMGRGMQALRPSVPADAFEFRDELARLHPQRDVPAAAMEPYAPGDPLAPEPILFLPDTLARVIKSTPLETASGPDGWRFEHRKLAVARDGSLSDYPPRLLAALYVILHSAALGLLPDWYRDSFATAALSLLKKPNGGVRPVAVGQVDRRLVGATLLRQHMPSIRLRVPRQQTGVGIPSATEGCAQAVRQGLCVNGWHTMPMDMENGFNAVNRQLVMDETRARAPPLAALTSFLYHGTVPLTALTRDAPSGAGFVVQMSSEGVHQGCALGPTLFCLAISTAVETLTTELDAAVIALHLPARPLSATGAVIPHFDQPYIMPWYIDDGFPTGPPALLRVVSERAPILFRPLGLRFRNAKSFIYPPVLLADDAVARPAAAAAVDVTTAIVPQVVPASEGITVLGTPVGEHDWEIQQVHGIFEAVTGTDLPLVRDFTRLLSHPPPAGPADTSYAQPRRPRQEQRVIPDEDTCRLQCASLVAVRVIFARVAYVLRMVRPSVTFAAAYGFDLKFREALAGMFHLPVASLTMDTVASRIAALPIRRGGLQWRRATDVALRAFFAGSVAAARVAVTLTDSVLDARVRSVAAIPFAAELGIILAHDRVVARLTERMSVAGWDDHHSALTRETLTAIIDRDLVVAPTAFDQRLQRYLTGVTEHCDYDILRRELPRAQADALMSGVMRGAYDLLTTVPWTLSLTVSDHAIRIYVARRLQLPVLPADRDGQRCPLRCTPSGTSGSSAAVARRRLSGAAPPPAVARLDSYGHHSLLCPAGGVRLWRHNCFAALLMEAARSVGWVAAVATPAATHFEGFPRSQEQVDIVLYGSMGGSPPQPSVFTNIDVSVVHIEHAGHMTRIAERAALKRRRYLVASSAVDHEFTPFILTSSGGLGPDALVLLRAMGQAAATAADSVWVGETFLSYWARRFSILGAQLSADAITRSLATGPPTSQLGRSHFYRSRDDYRACLQVESSVGGPAPRLDSVGLHGLDPADVAGMAQRPHPPPPDSADPGSWHLHVGPGAVVVAPARGLGPAAVPAPPPWPLGRPGRPPSSVGADGALPAGRQAAAAA